MSCAGEANLRVHPALTAHSHPTPSHHREAVPAWRASGGWSTRAQQTDTLRLLWQTEPQKPGNQSALSSSLLPFHQSGWCSRTQDRDQPSPLSCASHSRDSSMKGSAECSYCWGQPCLISACTALLPCSPYSPGTKELSPRETSYLRSAERGGIRARNMGCMASRDVTTVIAEQ